MWVIYALLSSVCASIMTVLMKVGLKSIDPNLATTIRTFFVIIMCLALVIATGKIKDLTIIDKKTWLYLILAAVATFFTWTFYFIALKDGKVSHVLALDKLSIVITIIISAIFLKEKITLKIMLGIILLVTGTLIIVSK